MEVMLKDTKRIPKGTRLSAALCLALVMLGGQVAAAQHTGPATDPHHKARIVNARDFGVDCSGKKDSAGALNALTGPGKLTSVKIVFPAANPESPCLVKLVSTWRIYNSTSFTVDGGARCGLPGNCTTFRWAGNAGGTVIDMEQVFGFEVKNVRIDGAGTAGIGVVVDQSVAGAIATYDGIFDGVVFNANASNSSGGPHQGWVGLSVSPTSRSNVADIRVLNSAFECMSSGKGSGTIGYALGLLSGSQNAVLEVIRHNYFEHCAYGIYQRKGGAIIEENTFGGDASTIDDIYLGGTASHERIVANWSESQQGNSNQFLKAAFSDVTGPGIEISGNQIPINGVCALDIGGNRITSREPNVWYKGEAYGRSGTKACATTNGYSFTWEGPSGLAWPADVTATLLEGIFLPGSLNNGPSAGMIAISSQAIAQGMPVKWTGAATVVGTTPLDTSAGVVVGVVTNAPGTAARPTYVMTAGYIIMAADGDCSVGQFVVVSKRDAGHVECESIFAAGKQIGVVLLGEKGGGPVYVQVGLR